MGKRIAQDWTGAEITGKPSSIVPSVSAVVLTSERTVLLQYRSDNEWWGIPGGSIEIGESVMDAAAREVLEETGLVVQPMRLVGVYSDPENYAFSSYPGGAVVHHVNLCFDCKAIGGELRGSDEGLKIGYYPIDSLPQPLLLSHEIRISDALLGQERAFIR